MKNEGKPKVKEELNKEEEELNKLVLGIMEGYSDSAIPPLSHFKPLLESTIVAQQGSSSRKRARTKSSSSAQECRAESLEKERGRRLKMNESLAILESLVPGLLPKTTREKVLHSTIEYIKYLEEKKKMLEKLKESSGPMAPKGRLALPCTRSSRNLSVTVTFSGNLAFFGIQTPKRQGLVTQIFMVFHKHMAEVLAANVVINHSQLTLTVTAFVDGNGSNTVEEIKRDILIL
ncbi:Myc-type, basic helix-loop-helix (bHLH) domain containing protein [Parasponia andersonii]|uniref:Myc-type, basic helix-loop-helix (BHLH) domain containing protein n=1 Tax=Parasponia andersonii TaxID=3476 RepID=A0A2P5E405_PARAD|nr:Myc-type, basic helix-loop-helix (bHLH) domain containing protein [Parasponia andersonii]